MIKFRIIIIIFLLITLGCNIKQHKEYGFKQTKLKYRWGDINVKLKGTLVDKEGDTYTKKGPYDLFVWFEFKNKPNKDKCKLYLGKFEILDKKTKKTIYSKSNLESKIKKTSLGKIDATFIFRNLDFDHKNLLLKLKNVSTDKCYEFQIASQYEILIEKHYHEREISFWDALMGI